MDEQGRHNQFQDRMMRGVQWETPEPEPETPPSDRRMRAFQRLNRWKLAAVVGALLTGTTVAFSPTAEVARAIGMELAKYGVPIGACGPVFNGGGLGLDGEAYLIETLEVDA